MSDLTENLAPQPHVAEETDPVALTTRMMVLGEHVKLAARKANLLMDMGLSQTEGFRMAYADYQTKMAEYTRVQERLGK